LASLGALGAGTRHFAGSGTVSWVAAIAVPLAAAIAWGTFAVPGDPSRSGKAPVPVGGAVRLTLETAVFLGGAAGLAASGRWMGFGVFVAAVVFHHVSTSARIRWLVSRRAGESSL
jgi:hypothetical protein